MKKAPRNDANFKCCIGLAFEITGNIESSLSFYREAIEIAKEVDKNEDKLEGVFSPFDYLEVKPKQFIKSVKDRMKKISENIE